MDTHILIWSFFENLKQTIFQFKRSKIGTSKPFKVYQNKIVNYALLGFCYKPMSFHKHAIICACSILAIKQLAGACPPIAVIGYLSS